MAQDKNQKTLNVPPLRFPGFTDEWKKITLGEIGETMIGLTYSPKDVVENGGTIVFRSSNIQNGMIDYSDLVRVTKPIKERIITKEKDILICARNGSQRLIGKNTLLRESDAGNTFGAFMMVYRSDDNDIIHPLLSTKQYISQVAENLGARINQITTSDLNSFEFFLPLESEEKRKIGQLFAIINERIATQNKIIEDLKKLKSAIIDCHFNGRKANNRLGDLIHEVSNRNKRNTDLPVLSVSNRQGFIAQSEQFENRIIASDDTSNYKIVIKNDFAYNPARINVGSIARLVNYESGIVSPMYICFRCSDEILPEYLELFFQSRYFQLEVEKRLEGSVRQCLSIDGIKSIQFGIFSISVQKVFAEKLKTIQTKLDNEETMNLLYQAKRKYLLSNMFI